MQITNSEIHLSITTIGKIENAPQFDFYCECYDLLFTFESQGIRYSQVWQCYTGELDKFIKELILLKDNDTCDEISFAPMNETGIIAIGKIMQPYETYYLKFRLPAVLRSEICVQGETMLDQSYIDNIIIEFAELMDV
ncbi:hypothetical protein D782_2109 [Enterobacteriaceae bacterium strain FGI 57]|jgi:hypothetical protein|nr:hypothetical protein D782_2109 [Enterobacteriaceae bacterium strain FGI 57]